jgi:acetyl esterase/lipase
MPEGGSMKGLTGRTATTFLAGALAGSAVVASAAAEQNQQPSMTPAQFQSLPSKPADHRIRYGTDPNQFAELRLPSSPGPHPVVVLVHGGCWKADFATLRDMAPMGDALKAEGLASWNIEYRRLPQPGSGWPGTYLDVGHAIDRLRTVAGRYRLDLDRVIVVGHSAGGHLAIWAAARDRLPHGSALYMADPLPLRGVVDIAGPPDMEAERQVEQIACGAGVVEALLGGTPAQVPERYAQSSAMRMLPLTVPQVLVWGGKDRFAPMWLAEDFMRVARNRGDGARLLVVPEAGHFELATPAEPAWPKVLEAIRSLLETGRTR